MLVVVALVVGSVLVVMPTGRCHDLMECGVHELERWLEAGRVVGLAGGIQRSDRVASCLLAVDHTATSPPRGGCAAAIASALARNCGTAVQVSVMRCGPCGACQRGASAS
jgi:hypothetical protein